MKEGAPYIEVKKVITVSVGYFFFGQVLDYVYNGDTTFKGIHKNDIPQLSEKQKEMFKSSMVSSIFPNHYIIKVNEIDDVVRNSLDQWIYFLNKNSEIRDEFNAKGLAETREKLREINLDEKELKAFNFRYRKALIKNPLSTFASGGQEPFKQQALVIWH